MVSVAAAAVSSWISDAFTQPEMATDLFEHDLGKLNILVQRGKESFAKHESVLSEYLL
jgi:hypothetical protein